MSIDPATRSHGLDTYPSARRSGPPGPAVEDLGCHRGTSRPMATDPGPVSSGSPSFRPATSPSVSDCRGRPEHVAEDLDQQPFDERLRCQVHDRVQGGSPIGTPSPPCDHRRETPAAASTMSRTGQAPRVERAAMAQAPGSTSTRPGHVQASTEAARSRGTCRSGGSWTGIRQMWRRGRRRPGWTPNSDPRVTIVGRPRMWSCGRRRRRREQVEPVDHHVDPGDFRDPFDERPRRPPRRQGQVAVAVAADL